MLKTSNLTLKRKQFCTPREGNPGNVLLTSRICLKYFYQCGMCINVEYEEYLEGEGERGWSGQYCSMRCMLND